MGPHTILDEGIERTLDLIARTAGVDVVMPYSHAYNAGLVKPHEGLRAGARVVGHVAGGRELRHRGDARRERRADDDRVLESSVYRATLRAFHAGADGVVASREYEEMKVANLEAVGRAVRDIRRVAAAT